jgi:hypothetical protein
MKLLSESQDYRYYAVVLPANAKDIRLVAETITWNIGNNIYGIETDWLRKLKILGVIGKESGISEEVAKEVLGDDKCKAGLNNIFLLKFRLKEKGILIENPIPSPTGKESHEKLWQEHESKLVKAVIIKVKK